jgi:hypothetical protein
MSSACQPRTVRLAPPQPAPRFLHAAKIERINKLRAQTRGSIHLGAAANLQPARSCSSAAFRQNSSPCPYCRPLDNSRCCPITVLRNGSLPPLLPAIARASHQGSLIHFRGRALSSWGASDAPIRWPRDKSCSSSPAHIATFGSFPENSDVLTDQPRPTHAFRRSQIMPFWSLPLRFLIDARRRDAGARSATTAPEPTWSRSRRACERSARFSRVA